MIRVDAQPEPSRFDADVRQKGLNYLQSAPAGSGFFPYWRACLDDLYSSYEGKCAYLAVHFERVMGCGSVDHFIAKSQSAALAYEWNNFRLSCTKINSRKRNFEDILDPFEIGLEWFNLEIVSGRIYPNPKLDEEKKILILRTIDRLGLNDGGNREMRARHYQDYREGLYTDIFLQRRSPFVYAEAARQGLL